jgi:AcrR family transcriptional regulator
MFDEPGYERATTAEIAQRLGAGEGTAFTCFGGRRALAARLWGELSGPGGAAA